MRPQACEISWAKKSSWRHSVNGYGGPMSSPADSNVVTLPRGYENVFMLVAANAVRTISVSKLLARSSASFQTITAAVAWAA